MVAQQPGLYEGSEFELGRIDTARTGWLCTSQYGTPVNEYSRYTP
jgi:hypothetical protein